jgi:hypothetical protein
VDILQKRFGCKQQIVSKHMDILINLDPVVSGSVKALRHLYDLKAFWSVRLWRKNELVVTNHETQTRVFRSTLMTNSTQSNLSCCYCQQGHFSNNCTRVTDTEERKAILRKTGWCYICLRKGHMSKSCRSRSKCYKCKGRHHTFRATAGLMFIVKFAAWPRETS